MKERMKSRFWVKKCLKGSLKFTKAFVKDLADK